MQVDYPPYRIDGVQELACHDDRAWHVAWNPVLASCSADKSVRMYSYSADLCFSHLTAIPRGHTKTVRALAWAPSSPRVWEQEEGEGEDEEGYTGEVGGHETECKSVACSRDKTVWIWEGAPPDADFECMTDVKCVAWHPVEEILASGSYDDTIKLYVDDPSDDCYLASASDDCAVCIWRQRRIAQVGVRGGAEGRRVRRVRGEAGRAGPNLGWVAAAGRDDGVVRMWELEERDSGVSQRLIAQLTAAYGVHDVNSVVWCPRAGFENVLAATGDDGATRIWRVVPAVRNAIT
ncbi:WD40-repeat-containing domain protein [Mycena rebaudengoi]|nr:WD40-repeat-containing domain protein [Mycena rebaudengoi]